MSAHTQERETERQRVGNVGGGGGWDAPDNMATLKKVLNACMHAELGGNARGGRGVECVFDFTQCNLFHVCIVLGRGTYVGVCCNIWLAIHICRFCCTTVIANAACLVMMTNTTYARHSLARAACHCMHIIMPAS